MKEIDLATQTLFAELLQRSLDAQFDAEYRENGTFVRKRSKDREYWHLQAIRSATSTSAPRTMRVSRIVSSASRASRRASGAGRRSSARSSAPAFPLPMRCLRSPRIAPAVRTRHCFRIR